jgi:2-iminobutanoate/2-iminopropanoate deaminase
MSTHRAAPAIEVLHPSGLPAPLGPYSHGVRAGELVFCAGQLALDRATSAPLADLPVREQTAIVLANLAETLQAAGSSLQRVVRTTVYLVDLDDYDEMNAAYREAFGQMWPARATFAVKELLGGLRVEIDAVAIVDPTVRA